jgi:hypothetical protein
MHHAIAALHYRRYRGPIEDVAFREGEFRVFPENFQARLFQRRVVVGVQIIEPDHLVAACEECFAQVETDESGGAGDEDFHMPRYYQAQALTPRPS